MSVSSTRRRFLKTTAAGGALCGLGDLGFLSALRPVSAAEAEPNPHVVQLRADIEPLVRLLEETPRERLLEEVATRIHQGTTYTEVLAALLLAGVRNVQPRPSVGFKFHAVLVVNSAHLASLASPDEHRWLPIFWALDHFKSSQARDVRENDWTMAPVDEANVPSASKARAAFVAAMDNWDEQAADTAVAGLARTAGANDVFEMFFRYGARDFRSIGHKAIFVANSWRTLQCIGWQHAEPVLRSLAYALQNHEGDNPAHRDAEADLPWRRNLGLAEKIRSEWLEGRTDDAATVDMLAVLRQGTHEEACDKTVEMLNAGIAAQSIWDAILCGAGELLMCQPGIVALHAVTSANALRFAFQASGDDQTRRMMLLQNAAFVPLFRQAARGRGTVKDVRIDQLQPGDVTAEASDAVDEIFATVSGDRMAAAGKVLAHLERHAEATPMIDAARVLVFLKGHDSHDYKFSSAALEDHVHLSPGWRDRYLASSVFNLKGSGDRDNRLVERIRAALA